MSNMAATLGGRYGEAPEILVSLVGR